MFRTALRNVLGHKLRLLTTGLAVAIGVAFMAGTLVLTDTIGQTMDDMFASAYAKTDALVRSESTVEVQGLEMRARIDEAILSDLTQLPGVAEAQGDVWGFAQVVGKDGEPVGVPGMGPPTIGANWADAALNTWTMEDGRGPHAADEVVLDKGVADEAGYVVGDTATVLVVGAPIQVTVTGIATFAGSDSPGGASFVMFTTEAAQQHVGEPGKFDSVSLSAMPDVSEEELVQQVEEILPSGMEALTGAAYTEENQDAMAQALSFFDTFLLIFAFVALFVGGFIIFNTFFITVAQRTRQHALLRAVGASRRQVLASILVEALFVGIVASAVGLVGGVGIAAALKALLAGFGVDLPAGGIVFTTSTAVLSLAAGVIVTLVAAVAPARKAGKVPPIAAMRDVQAPSSAYGSKLRIAVGVLVLAVGVAALLYGLWGSPANAFSFVGAGAALVLFADTILARTVSRPLSQVIGFPIRHLRGMTGHLARENAMRNPKRTAATASALMIGVALVSFITILASSTKTSFGKVVDRSFLGDVIITAPGQMGGGGLSPELAASLRELPEVETAAGIRFGMAEVDGAAEQLLAADDATFDVFDVDPVAGSPDDLDATSIAVFEDIAEDKGLSVGDEVQVKFAHTGLQTMEVALIYGENEPAGDWLLGTAAHDANYPPANHVDIQVFVKRADGVTPEATMAAVEREAEAYPGAKVLDQSEYKEEQLAFVDQMLGLVYALLALAVFIALLGIGNTLALSVLERTHELGLLRAVGMTRRQLRSTIRWEAVIIAVQGTLLGVIVGIFFGWAMVSALADEGLNTLDVPIPTLVVVMAIAAVAGVVAAILPARRAARMDVLKAVIAE
jgi:putative ABC transport system permease protein